MSENMTYVPSRLTSAKTNKVVAGANEILDDDINLKQDVINTLSKKVIDLNSVPTSSTLTYTVNSVTCNFKVGDEVRVADQESETGYTFYKLYSLTIKEGVITASWNKLGVEDVEDKINALSNNTQNSIDKVFGMNKSGNFQNISISDLASILGVSNNFWSLSQTYEGDGSRQTLVTPYKVGNGHFHFLYLYSGASMASESGWGLVLGLQNFVNYKVGSNTSIKLGNDVTFSVDSNSNICISGFHNFSNIRLYVF